MLLRLADSGLPWVCNHEAGPGRTKLAHKICIYKGYNHGDRLTVENSFDLYLRDMSTLQRSTTSAAP